MPRWITLHQHPEKLSFIIEHDAAVGYYVYVYFHRDLYEQDLEEKEFCIRDQEDHLQDDLPMAKKFALHQFGIPTDSWIEVTIQDEKDSAP